MRFLHPFKGTFHFHIVWIILILSSTLGFAEPLQLEGKENKKNDEKVSKHGVYKGYNEPKYDGIEYQSTYLTMRDSVKIAVDYILPKGLEDGKKLPTILYQTRYVRSVEPAFPFRLFKDPAFGQINEKEIRFFTSHGYAVVIVDVRGSGASFGRRWMEFNLDEVEDGEEVVDWIIDQPWSNGKVGSSGVSYVGTTAELLLVNKHPAVKACVPRSNIFDLYHHMSFPGGVRQGPFVKAWEKTTRSLDNNNFNIFGAKEKLFVRGINPVDNQRDMLQEAIAMHKNNFNVFKEMFRVEFRNDIHPVLDLPIDTFSIHNYMDSIEASGTAIYRISGWYDGALTNSAMIGHLSVDNPGKLLMGPWDHGPNHRFSPYSDESEVQFNVKTEMLRFFDYYLKGINNGIADEEPVQYYTLGAEKWHYADQWPPPQREQTKFYFSSDQDLVKRKAQRTKGQVTYNVDYSATTTNTSRWNSQTKLYKNGPTHYDDRSDQIGKVVSFTTDSFSEPVELTGHPVVDLYLSADAKDATVFVYIEDVAPDGTVRYVTEGQFRALHRKVSEKEPIYRQFGPYHTFKKEDAKPLKPGKIANIGFDLLPISYTFRKGHKMRISIAGSDTAHFDLYKPHPSQFHIQCSKDHPSSVRVPLVNRQEMAQSKH